MPLAANKDRNHHKNRRKESELKGSRHMMLMPGVPVVGLLGGAKDKSQLRMLIQAAELGHPRESLGSSNSQIVFQVCQGSPTILVRVQALVTQSLDRDLHLKMPEEVLEIKRKLTSEKSMMNLLILWITILRV